MTARRVHVALWCVAFTCCAVVGALSWRAGLWPYTALMAGCCALLAWEAKA
jgi:hypothetical protein